jgi:8-oxo-dGTP pyrophosphatase MutT (NUDIX family)
MIRGLDYTGISCVCICRDGKGRFLLLQRGPEARDEQGAWEFGAGTLEFGETFEECVRRERKEEINAELGNLEFVHVDTIIRELGGRVSHWVFLLWVADVLNPNELRSLEPAHVTDIGWFTQDTLPSPRHSKLEALVNLAAEKGII